MRHLAPVAATAALLIALAPTARAEINVGESIDWLVVSRPVVVVTKAPGSATPAISALRFRRFSGSSHPRKSP